MHAASRGVCRRPNSLKLNTAGPGTRPNSPSHPTLPPSITALLTLLATPCSVKLSTAGSGTCRPTSEKSVAMVPDPKEKSMTRRPASAAPCCSHSPASPQ